MAKDQWQAPGLTALGRLDDASGKVEMERTVRHLQKVVEDATKSGDVGAKLKANSELAKLSEFLKRP